MLFEIKWVLKRQDLQMFGLKLKKRNFYPHEVVGRGSETQFQASENSYEITGKWLTLCFFFSHPSEVIR